MQSQNLSLLFGMPLWSFQDNHSTEANDKLLALVKDLKNTSDGVSFSNQGGWQSKGNLHLKPEFQFLIDVINQKLLQVGKDYGFGPASNRLKVTSMWANINPKGSSNDVHSHQSSTGTPNPIVISGCYYIKVPANSGEFVLHDFYRPMRYLQLPFQEPNLTNSFTIKLSPKDNSLLFFPAWAEHSVEANKSENDRFSIAFNVVILNNPNKM